MTHSSDLFLKTLTTPSITLELSFVLVAVFAPVSFDRFVVARRLRRQPAGTVVPVVDGGTADLETDDEPARDLFLDFLDSDTQALYLREVCFDLKMLRTLSQSVGVVSTLLFLFIFARTALGQQEIESRDSLLNLILLAGSVVVWYMARYPRDSTYIWIQSDLVLLSCVFMHKILATFTGEPA